MALLRDIMTTDVFTTSADASVAEVAKAMVKGRFGSAVVVQGALMLGIFTERDVLRAAASGDDLRSSRLSKWMTKDPTTAGPDTDSEEAAELMLSGGLRHLPVAYGTGAVRAASLPEVVRARM